MNAFTPALAQQTEDGPGFEERATALDAEIQTFIKDAEEFRARAEPADGAFARVLLRRSEDAGLVAIEKTHDLSQLVIDREAEGQDPGQWRDRATGLLDGKQSGIQDFLKGVLARKDRDASRRDNPGPHDPGDQQR
jgi:hypothetical protein